MKKKGLLEWLAEILVVIGGLNWGLVGAFQLDVVSKLLGAGTIAKAVYILVGIAALYIVIFVWLLPQGDKKKAS